MRRPWYEDTNFPFLYYLDILSFSGTMGFLARKRTTPLPEAEFLRSRHALLLEHILFEQFIEQRAQSCQEWHRSEAFVVREHAFPVVGYDTFLREVRVGGRQAGGISTNLSAVSWNRWHSKHPGSDLGGANFQAYFMALQAEVAKREFFEKVDEEVDVEKGSGRSSTQEPRLKRLDLILRRGGDLIYRNAKTGHDSFEATVEAEILREEAEQ